MGFKRFSLGDLITNSYIFFNQDEGKAVVFDAPAEPEKILDYLSKNNLTLEYIFLTHGHFDHIMALPALKEATGAKIVIHEAEEEYLNNNELNLSKIELPYIKADILVSDGDIIDFCGTQIKVIHTPGHTIGGVCYLFDNTLISGDTLFLKSIGRFDFPLGSFDDEMRSIKERLMVLPDDIKVYPGHGFSTTIGKERKENPYLI